MAREDASDPREPEASEPESSEPEASDSEETEGEEVYGPEYLNWKPWTREDFGPDEEWFRDVFFAWRDQLDREQEEYNKAHGLPPPNFD